MDENQSAVGESLASFPLQALRVRHFSIVRDFQRGVSGTTSDWAQLLGDLDANQPTLQRTAKSLAALGKRFIASTPQLKELSEGFEGSIAVAGLGRGARLAFNLSSLEPEEILRGLAPELKTPGSNRGFAPNRHGLGTQAALLFRAYELYLERVLKTKSSQALSAMMTVEEPEAHMHPTAQRAMIDRLKASSAQVVVATHSAEIVQRVSTKNVRVLHTSRTGVRCSAANVEERHLYDHGRACFARCVLIVEGVGERLVIEEFARHIALDLGVLGIEVIEAGGQGTIPGLWETFGPPGFGLPTICIADADRAAFLNRFLDRAVACGALASNPPDQRAKREALSKLRYYTPRWGENLECALARIDPSAVDDWFAQQGDVTHATWLLRQQVQSTPWGERRPAELTDIQSRALRVSKDKAGAPQGVAALLCGRHPGKQAVPPYIRDALFAARAAAEKR